MATATNSKRSVSVILKLVLRPWLFLNLNRFLNDMAPSIVGGCIGRAFGE